MRTTAKLLGPVSLAAGSCVLWSNWMEVTRYISREVKLRRALSQPNGPKQEIQTQLRKSPDAQANSASIKKCFQTALLCI